MPGFSQPIEILGHHHIVTSPEDIDKVVAACTGWTTERDVMRKTGLGKGRTMRALALAGDRLERQAQSRNTCWQRWVWRRREGI